MTFNMTSTQNIQRDASQEAIARWEDEGGASTSFPSKRGKESAERVAVGSRSNRPIGRGHEESRDTQLGQPER